MDRPRIPVHTGKAAQAAVEAAAASLFGDQDDFSVPEAGEILQALCVAAMAVSRDFDLRDGDLLMRLSRLCLEHRPAAVHPMPATPTRPRLTLVRGGVEVVPFRGTVS